jgi:hypothetical protein
LRPSLRAKRSNPPRGHGSVDRFVAEFIIGPAEGRTRWLLAMTKRTALAAAGIS